MAIPFDTWRPFRSEKELVDVQTIVRADNDADPTNWVTAQTITFPSMPAGNYNLIFYFAWRLEDVNEDTGGLFRAGINGAYGGDRIMVEPKDSDETFTETWADVYALGADGDIVVTFDFLKTDAGTGIDPLIVSRTLLTLQKVP